MGIVKPKSLELIPFDQFLHRDKKPLARLISGLHSGVGVIVYMKKMTLVEISRRLPANETRILRILQTPSNNFKGLPGRPACSP